MEIMRDVRSWGNSAGVLLPKDWKGKEVKIILIDRSLEIKKEVFDILNPYFNDILGIYLVGSYARGESTERSDVDLLVITNKTNKRIEKTRYNLILISKENIEKELEKDVLPLLPMLKEAKPLLNAELIEEYKKTPLTKKNLRFHIETTKSAMKMNKAIVELNKLDKKNVSDNIMYSLILRLREVYVVACLIKDKIATTKELTSLIKKLTGSKESYEAYLRSKDEKNKKEIIPVEEAEKIYNYIIKKIKEQKKWVGKRKEKRK